MSHARCYAEPSRWRGNEVTLAEAESRHLANVLRAQQGDRVTVFDGRGRVAEALVAMIIPNAVVLSICNTARSDVPSTTVTLFLAVIREQRMDVAVQKAVELGVWNIVPVLCARSVVRIDGDRREERRQRWQRIADNAAGQCGAAWVPQIEQVIVPADLAARKDKPDMLLAASLEPDAKPLGAVIDEQSECRPGSIGFLVGPEGDFTPEEMTAIKNAGAIPVSLGNAVLRSETAAIYVLSVLKYTFGS